MTFSGKIGIFDSGVGGFSVVKEVLKLIPNAPIVYFGDTARTPYGTKSPEILKRYALEDANFLIKKGASIIVIACHSAASCATDFLREKLDYPIFEVVTPSVNEACKLSKKGKIGIIGTRATIISGIYERLIPLKRSDAKVFQRPCPLLVPLVEEGWLKSRETRMIVRKYLRPLKEKQIDTLVLGCTHYPLLKPIIKQKAGKGIKIVDPSKEVSKLVKNYIDKEGGVSTSSSAQHEFFVSDLPAHTTEIVKRFLGKKIPLKKEAPKD